MVRQTIRMPDTPFNHFLSDESGATAMEYCVLGVFLGLTMLAGATALGNDVFANFKAVADWFLAD